MHTDDFFKGKWIVRYNPEDFEYRQILEFLADIDAWLKQNPLETNGISTTTAISTYIKIVFDRNVQENFFYFDPGFGENGTNELSILMQLKDNDLDNRKEYKKPGNLNKDKKIEWNDTIKIKTIHLSYPVLLTDKRWETIGLTSSTLFIGSALANGRFNVTAGKQILPVTTIDPRLTGCDLTGLTLFEDLFAETGEFLSRLRGEYKYEGLIAAGGPLITLTPAKAAYHLPGINLMVRGEAEFALPGLIKAINKNDLQELFKFKGFLFQIPGTVVISDFNEINLPDKFDGFRFNLDFLGREHFEKGLEINLSRGCKRTCTFCSAVQGKRLRKLPGTQFENLLEQFSDQLTAFNIKTPHARTVNIDDDDILQDPDYAGKIFQSIKKNNFRLWGIQTSINSFFNGQGEIDRKAVEVIDDKSLYVDDNPLVWPGTDAFLKQRGKRLGKMIPEEYQMLRLVEELEKRKIRNYHYWISSDHGSNWPEFAREFMFIYRLQKGSGCFGLIAHAPFPVPYSTTPLYKQLIQSPGLKNRIKYKQILKSGREVFTFPLVERVETGYGHLNRLLSNEKLENRLGFFDYLGQKDYLNAFITLYNFLKQERMEMESSNRSEESRRLIETEKEVEGFIAKMT